ncbi:MAG: ribosomal-processing cysteine protease Prp [Bacilli bacterium]|nr:ribosomal-processing cysteine protease Prp [Bacilli bacterium]MDD4282389.1 ribosomal-processing cysteine protease Prp [Bacilli bacterium]MDD4718986.1 ribosomal-processing cysteine protease Prp [Bacilli bacterium]
MIRVSIKKNNDLIDKITIKGHANFDEFGSDIVCASVSSIVITSINAMLRLDKDCLDYKEADGLIEVIILKRDLVTDTLVKNMIDLLKELEKEYPKNIKLS